MNRLTETESIIFQLILKCARKNLSPEYGASFGLFASGMKIFMARKVLLILIGFVS